MKSYVRPSVEDYQRAAATPEEIDQLYLGLTQLRWQGIQTPRIEWSRDGDVAVARFGWFEDATMFVHGYLRSGIGVAAIRKRHTEESLRLINRLAAPFLPMESMHDQIEIPERQPWGTPVTVRIPLEVINPLGLQELLDYEKRTLDRNRAVAAQCPEPC